MRPGTSRKAQPDVKEGRYRTLSRTGGSPPTRVVLDTNVYLSALVFGGKPEELVRLSYGRRPHLRLLISEDILSEIVRNLVDTFGWPDAWTVRTAAFLNTIGEEVKPNERLSVVGHEPDNRVLECAVAGRAAYVVSGDKHLLVLERYTGIRVVTVSEMLGVL